MNEKNKENESVVYEVGFHLLPNIEESGVLAEFAKIKSLVEENGGSIIGEEVPKMINLAYDLSKVIGTKKQNFSKAYFGWIKFEAEATNITDIKSKIESLPNMLRFLIVKTVKENTMHTPKIPMFKKDNLREEKEEEKVEKPKASAEEIDKSIDELLVTEN